MTRRLLVLAGAFAIVVGGGTAGAQGDSQGADNLAAGTGTLNCKLIPGATCDGVMLHVNAQSDAMGVNPRGHFWIRYPANSANGGAEFGGAIVCLNVAGKSAGLTGRIDQVNVPSTDLSQGFVLGNLVQIRITDDGSPGTAADLVNSDMVNFDKGVPPPDPPAKPVCGGMGDIPISQGNFVVHDQPVVDLTALDLLLAQFEAAADDPYGG
jgi:hypothetical protein